MSEDNLVQMRALVRAETMDGGLRPRQVFWTTPAKAHHYIQHRIAELWSAQAVGPSEIKPLQPEEVKAEPVKKSSSDATGTPSTDSVSLNADGRTSQSFASRLGQVLTTGKSKRSVLTLPKRK